MAGRNYDNALMEAARLSQARNGLMQRGQAGGRAMGYTGRRIDPEDEAQRLRDANDRVPFGEEDPTIGANPDYEGGAEPAERAIPFFSPQESQVRAKDYESRGARYAQDIFPGPEMELGGAEEPQRPAFKGYYPDPAHEVRSSPGDLGTTIAAAYSKRAAAMGDKSGFANTADFYRDKGLNPDAGPNNIQNLQRRMAMGDTSAAQKLEYLATPEGRQFGITAGLMPDVGAQKEERRYQDSLGFRNREMGLQEELGRGKLGLEGIKAEYAREFEREKNAIARTGMDLQGRRISLEEKTAEMTNQFHQDELAYRKEQGAAELGLKGREVGLREKASAAEEARRPTVEQAQKMNEYGLKKAQREGEGLPSAGQAAEEEARFTASLEGKSPEAQKRMIANYNNMRASRGQQPSGAQVQSEITERPKMLAAVGKLGGTSPKNATTLIAHEVLRSGQNVTGEAIMDRMMMKGLTPGEAAAVLSAAAAER